MMAWDQQVTESGTDYNSTLAVSKLFQECKCKCRQFGGKRVNLYTSNSNQLDPFASELTMCMFIVWYLFLLRRLLNLHPWYRNSLCLSLISTEVNSAFARFVAAIANHYNLHHNFHQIPITAGWTQAAWYERVAQHLYKWPV